MLNCKVSLLFQFLYLFIFIYGLILFLKKMLALKRAVFSVELVVVQGGRVVHLEAGPVVVGEEPLGEVDLVLGDRVSVVKVVFDRSPGDVSLLLRCLQLGPEGVEGRLVDMRLDVGARQQSGIPKCLHADFLGHLLQEGSETGGGRLGGHAEVGPLHRHLAGHQVESVVRPHVEAQLRDHLVDERPTVVIPGDDPVYDGGDEVADGIDKIVLGNVRDGGRDHDLQSEADDGLEEAELLNGPAVVNVVAASILREKHAVAVLVQHVEGSRLLVRRRNGGHDDAGSSRYAM